MHRMHEKHVFVGRGTLRRAVQSTLEDSGGRKRTYALIPDERGGVPPIFGKTRFENTPETLRFPACKRHSCVASGRNPCIRLKVFDGPLAATNIRRGAGSQMPTSVWILEPPAFRSIAVDQEGSVHGMSISGLDFGSLPETFS